MQDESDNGTEVLEDRGIGGEGGGCWLEVRGERKLINIMRGRDGEKGNWPPASILHNRAIAQFL